MVAITLPDGSVRRFDSSITGEALAADIGPGLAKAALAVKVDGELRDLARPIDKDAKVEIVTGKHKDALELPRHDCAHVLAEAVQELYPGPTSPSARRSRTASITTSCVASISRPTISPRSKPR